MIAIPVGYVAVAAVQGPATLIGGGSTSVLSTGWSWAGAALGMLFAAGVALVAVGLPRNRRPGLEERLAPYLRDTPRPSRLLAIRRDSSPDRTLSRLAAPLVRDLARSVERVLGGAASVRRRLERAGLPPDVDAFRASQVMWGALGGLAGLGLGAFSVARGGGGVVPAVLLVLVGVGVGIVARDQALSQQARRREVRILQEFPTIAELLALAISAGEGATGALERVCRLSHGELSGELRTCLADARAGANLPTALQGLADRTGLVSLARFVDGIIIAVERGTPLAEVMRAQAQDVREAGRRHIMEEGGKKEIAMMIPVVFLVLPVTVLFAVYPGLLFFRLSV